MSRLQLNNSESGLSVRNKLNTMFTELYSDFGSNDDLDETKFKDLTSGTLNDVMTSNGNAGFSWKNLDTLLDNNIKASYIKGVTNGTTNKVLITDGTDGFTLADFSEGIFSKGITEPTHIANKAQWFYSTASEAPRFSDGITWFDIVAKDKISLPRVAFADLPTPITALVVILEEQERPIWYDVPKSVWRNFSGSEVNF